MEILDKYEQALLGALGSIQSNKVVTSKESSKVIRDCSKLIDSLSVELRRELILVDKTLTINPVVSNG